MTGSWLQRHCLRHRIFCLMIVFIMGTSFMPAHEQDSIRQIDEVTIRGRMRYHETIQPQYLKEVSLTKMGAHTVADALRWMSGVQLKDYGGIGGLKTVNLRSMGSQHVGIYYDGIELGNAQNGVIDLGQFSLDNISEVSVYQGQRSAIMQTASDYVNAGSIYIRTINPATIAADKSSTRIRLQGASCNTLRLSALYSKKLSQRLSLSFNAEGLSSSGHYSFNYRRRNLDGTIAYDTTATRENGDVQAVRLEMNIYNQLRNGYWQTKAYTYHANRGIPGAIVNNVWHRGERQSDDNTFVQGSLKYDLNDVVTLVTQGKIASYNTHYLNNDTTQLIIDNRYHQSEAYGSIILATEVSPHFSISQSYDIRWNTLSANLPLFARPKRMTHQFALAGAFNYGGTHMQASVVYSHIYDKEELYDKNKRHNHLTPALFFSHNLSNSLSLEAFAKQSFRMPTFNDLYYTQIGNVNLRPEIATQYNLGIKYKPTTESSISLSTGMDLYHISVRDKIVAYPQGQQFRWTMLNLGSVNINGMELRNRIEGKISAKLHFETFLQYTFQQAIDVTDPNDSYYRHQIPYTPQHSGSATVLIDYENISLGYNFVYTGPRYCQQENIVYNYLQPWYTSDLTIGWKQQRWHLMLEVKNLVDQQYDVIINYPMPGRNYSLSVICEI